jgi:serine/threonine-protein kinase
VPEGLDALTAKLLAKDPGDRYASAAELAEDLRRVRDGLPPLAAGLGQETTARMPQDAGTTRTAPTVVAPGRDLGAGSGTRRALLPLGALLLGLVLLGGLVWALTQGSPDGGTQGAGGAERVKVPEVVGLSLEEAQGRLGDAGLELGSQTEANSGSIAAGAVIKQNPAAGTEAELGTAVDVVVSTGLAAEPTTQSSPSASASASPSASTTAPSSPTSTVSASPAGGAEPGGVRGEPQGEEAREIAKDRQEEAKEAAKDRQEKLKDAQKERKDKD